MGRLESVDRFWTNLGGVIGGYTMAAAPVDGTFLSSLNPILDVVGVAAMIVFGGILIFNGVKQFLKKG
jgi:hypothetical protein